MTAQRNLALFDLDNTLLKGDSDYEWPRFLIKRGIVDQAYYDRRNDHFYEQYKSGTLNIAEYLEFALEPLTRYSRQQLADLHAAYMDEHIRPIILPAALDLLAAHCSMGDEILIITATKRFVTGPIAAELGVDDEHLIAIDLETDAEGRYTGRHTGVPSFQDGKITRLDMWLAERGLSMDSFGRSFFYSDSHNDLPLLRKVSNPVAVDPDPTLRQFAQEQGWPVISLRG